ncbi:Inner nuclear membrane protein MAN1 [Ophiocordyceps sinensis CO18]|uniref:Inner nuclear membrane protein MAN1 n=1 Tax=Ophiocordyceps sinensis (strain Co18 / CGMCC 3.14243) TaxID=911162 RepID=T5ADG6_OPHSC|nr:Inner nuclear membrane protein MAN1 [Ophiocordyceps sinensis CO18]
MLDGDDYLQEGFDPRGPVEIVNAGSANDAHTWDDQELLPPPSALRRSRSPRKSSAKSRAEGQDVNAEPPLLSPRKRNSRSTSRQVSRADDEDVPSADLARSARRSRRTMTPQIKVESDEEGEKDELHLPQENASVFTDDNPFQSGSSPPAAKPPAYRRPTADDDLFKSVKTPTGRTEGRAHQIRASRSFALSTPLPRSESPEEPLEPGEEFTPGEQLELERAAREGEIHIAERKPAPEVARRTSLKTPLLVLFLALISAYGAWYRQEKIAVGYCGLGRPAKTLLPPELPLPDVLVSLVEPQCEQCPPHAYCYQDFSVRCEADFILEPHPLSLGGLVPFPPSCEPDGEKARRVHAVADKAVEELRERRAKFECGDLVDQTGQPQDSPAITGEDLKESVSKRRNKRLSRQEFDELWTAAIGEVATRDEVQSTEDENAGSDAPFPARRFSSTSLARLPLSCAVKRSVRLGLARYRVPIGLLILVALAVLYLRAQYRRHLATSAQVPALVDAVLGRLPDQKELGEEDLDDAWLFLPNLRDDVLRSVHSLSERERIWQRVRAVVEQNSNVRTGQREGRSGEVGRAWEWIGPGWGEGARRRRSGRGALAPGASSESPEGHVRTEAKKWEEPRPLY